MPINVIDQAEGRERPRVAADSRKRGSDHQQLTDRCGCVSMAHVDGARVEQASNAPACRLSRRRVGTPIAPPRQPYRAGSNPDQAENRGNGDDVATVDGCTHAADSIQQVSPPRPSPVVRGAALHDGTVVWAPRRGGLTAPASPIRARSRSDGNGNRPRSPVGGCGSLERTADAVAIALMNVITGLGMGAGIAGANFGVDSGLYRQCAVLLAQGSGSSAASYSPLMALAAQPLRGFRTRRGPDHEPIGGAILSSGWRWSTSWTGAGRPRLIDICVLRSHPSSTSSCSARTTTADVGPLPDCTSQDGFR